MIGRKKIQLRRIRESYRMRGKAARAIITNITRKEAVAAKEIGNINSKGDIIRIVILKTHY